MTLIEGRGAANGCHDRQKQVGQHFGWFERTSAECLVQLLKAQCGRSRCSKNLKGRKREESSPESGNQKAYRCRVFGNTSV